MKADYQVGRYGHSFIPPSGQHDPTCAYLCRDARGCLLEHSCKVCDAKARKEGRIR